MQRFSAVLLLASGLGCAHSSPPPDTSSARAPSTKTVLDLGDVSANPTHYEWFDFRPNVKKLILAGAPETEHVAILWYIVPDGHVGLHRHSKTESVYVIDGSQTDGKGAYPKGTAYFNPPGSGHEITNSSGFFLLAYAAPPDFAHTDAIGQYTPVRIDTADPKLMNAPETGTGAHTVDIPLDSTGGMSGRFIEITSPEDRYEYLGNYLLVLGGSCQVSGTPLGKQALVVAKSVKPESFQLAAAAAGTCLAMGVSF
ncbi:MAG: cupin domain-containing protein [Deltaproteobacteria bacterium]